MINLAKKYPGYGFEKHVGYGTAAHKQALAQLGICPEHRKSFRPIRELLEASITGITPTQVAPAHQEAYEQENNNPLDTTTYRGQHGEHVVMDYLINHDHQIIAHNYKTKLYEIDIVSTRNNKIYFTEVKYRKSQTHGSSLDQITSQKLKQMRFAATAFLASHPEFQPYQPVLAAAGVHGKDYILDDWFSIGF